jgi:hypothetical protein
MIDELAEIYFSYLEGVLDFEANTTEKQAIPIINEVFDILDIKPIKRLSSINKRNNTYIHIVYKRIKGRISITFHIINTRKSVIDILDIKDIINEYSKYIYAFDMGIYFIPKEPDIYINKKSILEEYARKDAEYTHMMIEGAKKWVKKATKARK